MKFVVLTLAALTYLSFIAGVWLFFRKVEPDPPMLTVLKVTALLSASGYVIALAVEPSSTTRLVVAAVLFCSSIVIFIWAGLHTRARRLSLAFSTDQPTYLLTTGPWQFIRHPFYSAYLLSYVAGTIGSDSLATLVLLSVMTAVYLRAAVLEERKFADSEVSREWVAWKARTGMFTPKLGRNQSRNSETQGRSRSR